MLELGRHPDVQEALKYSSVGDGSSARNKLAELARSLAEKAFLATEHPNAWVTEVVREFYLHPELAADVWVRLRYCKTFRQELAELKLHDESRKVKRWWHSLHFWKKPAEPVPQARTYMTDPRKAVREYADDLGSQPDVVTRMCEEAKAYPEPPTFIADLVTAENKQRGPAERDTRIRELLSDPRLVREIAATTHTPVPFSIVQEEELDQVCKTRQEVRPPTAREKQAARPGRLIKERDEPFDNRSDAPLTYQGSRESESVRRIQREARRSTMDDVQRSATDEVMNKHAQGKYPRHSARLAIDMNLFGLAFSGGGIRSATFNLGVLQALSQIGLLRYVDYLSTVSGGGYIGSWLAAWIRRELDDMQQVPAQSPGAEAMNEIQRRLSPIRSPNPLDERVRPIRFLREYSNYLTPRPGFFSTDTWTMIGIYVRNTLLNQVIIATVFATILLAPRNWFPAVEYVQKTSWRSALPVVLWMVATFVLMLNLRQLDPRDASAIATGAKVPGAPPAPPKYARPWIIHALVVLPWLLTAAFFAQPLGESAVIDAVAQYRTSAWVGVVIASTIVILLLGGRTDRCWASAGSAIKGFILGAPAIAGSAAMAGAVAGGLWWLFIQLLPARLVAGSTELRWHLNALAPPALMAAASLAIVAMLGMLGERFPDEHREWWSRLRTTMHVYAIGWLTWFLVALYVPWAVHVLAANGFGIKWGAGALVTWVSSTLIGVIKGPKAEADQKEQTELKLSPSLSGTAIRWAAFSAPYVFVTGLVLGLSVAIDQIYAHNAPKELQEGLKTFAVSAYWDYAKWTTTTCLRWTGICAAVALVFSWRVDINEFSIHHFYKNRLVRCYLGASHTKDRKPEWFTGLDANDDLPLQRFDRAAATTPEYAGPYPIVNCALNLVRGKDLAWQERKATSFVFTPKYCGYDVDRSVLAKDRDQHSEGFVRTNSFYNRVRGPLLGMAMAISGAAANPNMGRASSPALSFLMTVFNVRLGWWIGNPRHRTGKARRSPSLGLVYTLFELFGMTDDTRRFVNLSDGGHFDNLGVYELVRRNCRYIVVCDAGHDDRFICEDLGTVIRRCRMDFGVDIDIAVDRIRQRDSGGRSQAHCVVGKINYLNLPRRVDDRLICDDGTPLRPGCKPAHETGYLVYIKPTLTGDEPQDVLEFARRVTRFPHQNTADQWFGESQFESYRTLGMHIGMQTFSRYQPDDTHAVGNLDDLFEQLYRHWYPPSIAINERTTEHAAEYSRIMEIVRSATGLQGLDQTLFTTLVSAATPPLSTRDEFYICNSLIQLMENVYADLDLENNWGHPHVIGWMQIFRGWAQQRAFRDTWAKSKSTYAERFQSFYEDRLL
jgi:hypothetical protein